MRNSIASIRGSNAASSISRNDSGHGWQWPLLVPVVVVEVVVEVVVAW